MDSAAKTRAPAGDTETANLLEQVTIRSVDDVHDAAIAMRDYAHSCGLRVALCEDIASNEPMIDAEGTIINADIFGWLEDGERWWEDRRLALNSPLPQACRYESEPFWCNSLGFYGHWQNEYLKAIDLSDFFGGRQFYRASIVVPVHLPFSQISANSFVPFDQELEDMSAIFREHSEILAQLTRRFVAGYATAMRTTRRIPSNCKLSKHEVECLRWAAIGKTDKEISIILSRSHATIRYHIHRAGEKLDAVNRAQTIFKAGQLGYLGASD